MGGCRRITHSVDETALVGAAFGREISPGDVVLLSGDYGVGKTEFVRGIVQGYLGELAGEQVASPSFALLHTYERGGRRICHYDFYRLNANLVSSENLFQEVEEEDVVCVEWAEGVSLPRFRRVVKVTMSILASETREIDIEFVVNKRVG